MKLALFYIVSPPLILIISLVVGITQEVSPIYWTVFALYIVLNGAALPLRKKGCSLCAMREICPGSAVKSS
jgi:hypothetical protein